MQYNINIINIQAYNKKTDKPIGLPVSYKKYISLFISSQSLICLYKHLILSYGTNSQPVKNNTYKWQTYNP